MKFYNVFDCEKSIYSKKKVVWFFFKNTEKMALKF